MDTLELLALPYETLPLQDRAAALLHARDLGKQAADNALSADELEVPSRMLYFRDVISVDLAHDTSVVDNWRRKCMDGSALSDPRVQAFFFGWHERATEILSHIQGDSSIESDAVHARWFLEGLQP